MQLGVRSKAQVLPRLTVDISGIQLQDIRALTRVGECAAWCLGNNIRWEFIIILINNRTNCTTLAVYPFLLNQAFPSFYFFLQFDVFGARSARLAVPNHTSARWENLSVVYIAPVGHVNSLYVGKAWSLKTQLSTNEVSRDCKYSTTSFISAKSDWIMAMPRLGHRVHSFCSLTTRRRFAVSSHSALGSLNTRFFVFYTSFEPIGYSGVKRKHGWWFSRAVSTFPLVSLKCNHLRPIRACLRLSVHRLEMNPSFVAIPRRNERWGSVTVIKSRLLSSVGLESHLIPTF